MDELQGGDWSSFFHKFEAVASQSTANVSHPSIVDDNVPLPIIRGHHFDIAYHDAMDEHVKCQVCGMLLRRTMFAAHVQQRHPELCPPLSTDDDSGRHSGLESPDISRNPSFPFSPKLMSPPIKEPIKLTISMKGHRKHRRRKSKRDRRRESRTASLDEEELSPRGLSPKLTSQPHRRDDRYLWPSDGEQPGPLTHRVSPVVLREKLAVSPLSKGLGSSGGAEHLRSRIALSDQVRDRVEHSPDEQSKRKTKKRTRRKSNIREVNTRTTSPLPKAPADDVRPILPSEGSKSIGTPAALSSSTNAHKVTDARAAERREHVYPLRSNTRSAFTNVPSSPKAKTSPGSYAQSAAYFHHQGELPAGSGNLTVLVGQPAKRARAVHNLIPSQITPVRTVPSPLPATHSESIKSPKTSAFQLQKTRKGRTETADESPKEIPPDPIARPAQERLECVSLPGSVAVEELETHSVLTPSKSFVTQKKSRQLSGSQEAWEPLGIKSPTYGVVLPVATKNDNDADDATVAFLTSSPELLSEDDSCAVKEEVDESQMGVISDSLRIVRQRFRSTAKMVSESSDTDQRTIIDVEEDQAERTSSDRDEEVQKLSMELAALPRPSGETAPRVVVESAAQGPPVADLTVVNEEPVTDILVVNEGTGMDRDTSGSVEVVEEGQRIPVLDSAVNYSKDLGRLAEEVISLSTMEKVPMDWEPALLSEPESYSSQLDRGASSVPMHIPVVVSSRPDDGSTVTTQMDSSTLVDYGTTVGTTSTLTKTLVPEEEEGNMYDEDYSTDDEELVHLHESSERLNQEDAQQSEYEDMLRQKQPSLASPIEDDDDFTGVSEESQSQIVYQPPHEAAFQHWSSQAVHVPGELKVQTVFDSSGHSREYHSDPTLRNVAAPTFRGAFGSYAVGDVAAQSAPPHTFPLQKQHPQQVSIQQNTASLQQAGEQNLYGFGLSKTIPQGYRESTSYFVPSQPQTQRYSEAPVGPGGYAQYQAVPRSACFASTVPDSSSLMQIHPTIPQQAAVPPPHPTVPSHVAPSAPQWPAPPPHYQQRLPEQLSHEQMLMDVAEKEVQELPLQQQPTELMEEEMRAMRYVYLMNEQRIARRRLGERDQSAESDRNPPANMIFMSELLPVKVEPTATPEGVPRAKMQEHVIPPFHYAQFAVRRGPFVSPCGSDLSETLEDELRDNLREIMDLSVLEPPAAVTPLAKLKSQSNELSNGTERRQQFPHPVTTGNHAVQVYGLNEGLVHGNQQFVSGELNPLSPQRYVASSSPAQCSTSDDSAAEDRGGEGILRDRSSTCSSDTDVLRRGWDLSPSVSPLTLDALSSALSSPEESDSNDEQFGAPVWPTMSRKHAKLAIAVCRNMPKHLQPLCRRFAWQQGITYLLENFCLHKWEIRPEHDTESVWFFDNFVRRFKPFELLPWDVPSDDEEPPKRTENIFFGFNICADISMVRCRKTIKIEDRFSISFTCEEVPTKDGGGHDGRSESSSSPTTLTEHIRRKAASARIRVDDSVSDESDGEELVLPTKLSYEKQKFIALSCCKQFLEQLQLRKADKPFRSSGKSMVDVSHIMSLLYREHRAAYELMMSDIRPIPTPDPREIPYSDDAEWVASRILAINRAQNRLIIPSLPPWAAMHRLWSVYGPLRQAAAVIGGDYEQFANECINVACNQYYRLKHGIKVADEIPGDLLDLCFEITCERMREHTESVEAAKRKGNGVVKHDKQRIPLRRRETPSSFPSQRTANAELLTRCRRVYDEKRQTKRRRWNTMRYLHNALPGCVIEGIDVFDMAQRTNLSVAGIFGPEHKLSLTEMPFASNTDNRPAYLDMEELLNLMNHTIALQSGTTVDQDKRTQPCIDFLTTRGLHFKAVTGGGRCHLMVSPSPVPVPPCTVDRYGTVTSVQRAYVPKLLFPDLASCTFRGVDDQQFNSALESPLPDLDDLNNEFNGSCPGCVRTSSECADADFAKVCFDGFSLEMQSDLTVAEIDTTGTTYSKPSKSYLLTEDDLRELLHC